MAKRKKQTNAKKCKYDNIEFQSKLEMYCYKALKREGIPSAYEKRSIQILEGFKDPAPFFKVHGKAPLSEKTSNVLGMIYTPDYEDCLDNPHYGFFIELKGRVFADYPLRFKLFRLWRKKHGVNKDFFYLTNEGEVEQAIQIIKQNL